MSDVITLLNHYGYIVLFGSLFLELLAFPFPGEVLMSYAGYLVFSGKLSLTVSILMAGLGSSIGITLSYFIGLKLGASFFHKYGRFVHLGPDKLDKVTNWFEKYGNKLILIGFFIPGFRHVTGYFSGITQISFRAFATFAYLGAFIWTSTFIYLGKVLGPKWGEFHGAMKKYLVIAAIVLFVVIVIVYLIKKHKQQIIEKLQVGLSKAIKVFKSLGRVRVLVALTGVIFWGLFALMLGLIQDYLGNEFTQFDIVTTYIVQAIFDEPWHTFMKNIALIASYKVLAPIIVFTFVLIWKRGQDKWLEALFLIVVTVGAETLDEGLRRLFHRVGPIHSLVSKNLAYTFPSEQSLIVLVVLGFVSFLLVRHAVRNWIRIAASIIVLAIALFVGLSRIVLNIQYPSDVVAGYVFGGVWLSLNIILLEVFRQLHRIRMSMKVNP